MINLNCDMGIDEVTINLNNFARIDFVNATILTEDSTTFFRNCEILNLVGDYNTYDMHRRLNEVGNHSEVFVIPRTGHITIIATLSSWFSRYFQTKAVILKQLNQLFPPN